MAAPAPAAPPRRDASMSLLTNLMQHSLDEGYAQAARRREREQATTGGTAGVSAHRHLLLLAGLLAVGLLLSTAAVQAHNRAASAAAARSALAAQIERRTEANDRLQASLERDRARVAGARQDALRLSDAGTALAASLATLEALTGAGPVRGPALVVHLQDAAADRAGADVDPRTDSSNDGRVTDRDLQTVVNEMWAAGAEAVAVNGQRLTSLSAIRSAGDAVLVDFRPLSPPYDVVGIGDDAALRTRFLDGFGGSYLQALRDYGIGYDVSTRDAARLDASSGIRLSYARTPPAAASEPTS